MIGKLLSAGLALAAASPAFGQRVMSAPPGAHQAARAEAGTLAGSEAFGQPSARQRAYVRLRSTLRALRTEALALRAEDGGTLRPEHHALIQARLDRAQAAYRPYRSAPW